MLYSSYKHYNTHPLIPFGMCGTLSGVEWIDPLQNWAPSHGFGGLGSTCVPPLYTLVTLHVGTFHAE